MLTTLLCSHLAAAMPQDPGFEPPVRLTVDGQPIRVEQPGYACPSWHDVDGDGKPDLVVGQFHDGKMAVYRGLGDLKFAAREWLQAEGDVAVVPGVW
jgi:hypothetical protein